MSPELDERSSKTEMSGEPAAGSTSDAGGEDELAVLRRIERTLEEIRGRLETTARAQRHVEFSPARLIGALFEVLVLGLVIAALADWIYQAPLPNQLVKLTLAGVLQLVALTAFVLAPKKG